MNRRDMLTALSSIPFASRKAFDFIVQPEAGSAGESVKNVGADQSRYRLTLDRVLRGTGPAYTPEFLLKDVRATPGRRYTNFCGDLSGRWIGALSVSAQTFGDSFPSLHTVVKETINLQHSDGYFGGTFNYQKPGDNDLALLWGNGRLLVGLLEYYGLTRDPAVLSACKKLGDFLIRIAPSFNSPQMADAFSADHYATSYICWTQQTEGLAELYAATKDVRYRQLCEAIANRISKRPGDHVHGYLTSLRGVLALYRETGDDMLLKQVVGAWQDIQQSGDVLLTGGVPERWTPKRTRTEGCAECDWLRLNLALYRATGERKYMDAAHMTYFNEFQMNQFATGDFGHARLDSQGIPQTVYVRAWWCCTLHGLRTFADLQDAPFQLTGTGVVFVLPIDSKINDHGFAAEATSEMSTAGKVRITIRAARPDQTLNILRPSWATGIRVTRNGASVSNLTISSLAAGDVIDIFYGMTLRVEKVINRHDPLVSLHAGPWLLGIASGDNPAYFNELYAHNRFDSGQISKVHETVHDTFAVPQAAFLANYAPAEFPEQSGVAQLRAVATQTASQPETWQLVFACSAVQKEN